MNAFNDTKEETFRRCLGILHRLAGITDAKDLLRHEDGVTELFRNVIFLKGLEDHAEKLNYEMQNFQNQTVSIPEALDVANEEATDSGNISETDNSETANETIESPHQAVESIAFTESPEPPEDVESPSPGEASYEADREVQSIANEENNEKIESQAETQKRFRLAQIKNLSKNQPSLFADEFSQENVLQTPAKSNMPLEEMEASKGRPDFRLDLNDRIAFTQKLFGGSQTDLNNAVQILNSCKNAEEAKEYLSDLYYEKNWKKADDYAQRLWMLVENKFL